MIRILQIWCYIFITTYLTGMGAVNLLRLLSRSNEPGVRSSTAPGGGLPAAWRLSPAAYSMAGLAFVTVYAQTFSLAGGVGAAANLGLLVLCVICGIVNFPQIMEDCLRFRGLSLRGASERSGEDAGTALLFARDLGIAVLVLFYAYGASRGYIHTDTILYHAQSIRWAEEAGAVPGLALLHNRLGYNSAAFPLTALYSFPYLFGQSYHCVGGYLALLTMLECLKVLRHVPPFSRIRAGSASVTAVDFARLAGIYYLLTIYDEMISPASDYFMVCIGFYTVIRFLDLLENGEEEPLPYALLSMLAVWNVTMKLSAAPFVFLALWPVILYAKKKNCRAIAAFTVCALLTALPFLARNVVITGYLLYPYPSIDLFDLPWKIDAGYALSDQMEIAVWGRGYTDVYQYHAPLSYWVPAWFRSQSALHRLLLLADAAALPGIALLLPGQGRYCRKNSAGLRILAAVVAGGLIFWFTSAPLMRYGCVYVYLTAALFAGLVWQRFADRFPARSGRAFLLLLTAFFLWKGVSFGRELGGMWRQDGLIYLQEQKDYPEADCTAYEIDGVTFYHAEGKGTSYDAFPSSPFPAKIRLRGAELRDGFVPD